MGIHATAIVDHRTEIADDVQIGPFTIIGANVRIHSGTVIGSHCELGVVGASGKDEYLEIGAGSTIRSHSVFYSGSRFGTGLKTGHRVTVREGTMAGEGLQLGTLCDIQGQCTFGSHVRLHSNVFVAQLTVFDSFIWVFPYVVFTNDLHPPSDGFLRGAYVESYASIATGSVVLPGIRVGSRSLVGAQSLVNRDVPPDMVVYGNPAKVRMPTSEIMLSDESGPAYPWMRHFHRGYPQAVVDEWIREYGSGG